MQVRGGEEGGASEGQGEKKSRGWLLVFIQFVPLMVVTLLCYDKGTIPLEKIEIETEIG